MAKKQMSFAEKAAKHKGHKDYKTVKYVKSERSTKTGSWRFNEKYIQLATNENIDQALTRMEQEVKALAEEMALVEDISQKEKKKPAENVENVEVKVESDEGNAQSKPKVETTDQATTEA